MEKMLVTQALNELKTLDARINRTIKQTMLIDSAKTSESKVTPSKTKEDFCKEAISNFQSIKDLINRREKIKLAIVESNAKTMIEICGEKFSVANIIDMKTSIKYKKYLLLNMKEQYESAVSTMNRNNSIMEQKIDALVTTAFGRENKTSIKEDDYNSIAKPYRESNEYSLVNPINIEKNIVDLENYIEEFESTVDSKLQISNCITYIEF